MKRLWILPAALLIACGKPAGEVKFLASTPLRPQDPDLRGGVAYCSSCGKKTEFGASKCSDAKCGAKLSWPDTYPCGFCGATGECRACRALDQADQNCFNCRGNGFLAFEERSLLCTHCAGSGKCPICRATPGKCDQCGGSAKLTRDQVSTLVKKGETPKTE